MDINKQRIENYHKARQNFDEHESNLQSLEEKQRSLEVKLSELSNKINEAKQKKTEALDGFLTDKHGEGVAKVATDKHAELIAEEKNAKELLNHVNIKIAELSRLSSGLAQKQTKAAKEIWNRIYQERMIKIRDEIQDKVFLLYAINRQQKRPRFLDAFFNDLLPGLSRIDLRDYSTELNQIFEGELK